MDAINKENLENVYVKPTPATPGKQSVFKPSVSSPMDKKKKSTTSSSKEEVAKLKEELAKKNTELTKKDEELVKKNEEIAQLKDQLREQELAFLKANLANNPHRVRKIQALTTEKASLKSALAETTAKLEQEQKHHRDLQLHYQRQARLLQHQQHEAQIQQQQERLSNQQALAGLNNLNYYPGETDDYHPGEC
eukprot:Phypoly_transcript_18403.p1 GENE.Phypoly_transcript_18403~~Phypoly_transcript_18403.p1  ORF type:complete len:193 (+),score=59.25 Phypoly_transcript_18403:137-715(+)